MNIRVGHDVSEQFLQGMADRMEVSYHKYGPVERGFPDRVDAIASLREQLDKYQEDGNLEHLMDAANYAMIEFMCPRHRRAHFSPTDSSESAGRRTISGRLTQDANAEITKAGGRASRVQQFRES